MTNKVLAVFPGQGSQKVGMGQDLYQESDRAQAIFNAANQALNFEISKLCFEGPAEELTLTSNVQPAILTHSIACFELIKDKFGDVEIAAAAGHSLGEYSALVAAGSLSFEDAVLLVHKRGQYMQEAVPVGSGKMLAVLGQDVATIEAALQEVQDVEIANINAPGQIVVSGSSQGIEDFQAKNDGFKIIPLPVSVPSHCKLMQSAKEKLSADLDLLSFNSARFPIYTNFHAKASTEAEDLKQALKDQITGRVRWVESMENAINDLGIDTIVEFGPGNVLTGLMKRINKATNRINIQSLSDIEQCESF